MLKRLAIRLTAIGLGGSLLLTGCGFLGSLFPDKQKQYKYSTEIPSLEIPPDLTSSTIEGAAVRRGSLEERTGTTAEPIQSRELEKPVRALDDENDSEDEEEPDHPKVSEKPNTRPAASNPPATSQSTENIPVVMIDKPFAEAWNDVAKAVGRLKLEVSDQNRTDGLFYILFDEEDQSYEDRGFLGDLKAFFTAHPKPTKEYRIKVEEKGEKTQVLILDQDGQPQFEGEGLELLKRLDKTLQGIAKPESDEKE
jgi:uncharacterized lipoprotein